MLINKTKENEKLKGLQTQIIDMHADYEDMKKTREEAKKQLELKFTDIGSKLINTEDLIKEEEKRVHDKMNQFRNKVETQLLDLKNDIKKDFDLEHEFVSNKFSEEDKRLDLLEKMINDERAERIKHTEEQLNPIRNQLKNLQSQYESGKIERKLHEKEIYKKISDEAKDMNMTMEREKNDRSEKMQILKDDIQRESSIMDSLFKEFDKKVNIKLKNEKAEVFGEMDNRFSHQNEVVDDISKFIKAFQNTLKIVGKDV